MKLLGVFVCSMMNASLECCQQCCGLAIVQCQKGRAHLVDPEIVGTVSLQLQERTAWQEVYFCGRMYPDMDFLELDHTCIVKLLERELMTSATASLHMAETRLLLCEVIQMPHHTQQLPASKLYVA